MKFRVRFVTAAAFAALLLPLAARAATAVSPIAGNTTPSAINLEISPLPVLLTTKPGETVSSDLRVRNGGNEAQTLTTVLRKFTVTGSDGQVNLENRGPGDNYFDWVSFSPSGSFVVQPNQWQTVHMTIKIPTTAAFGYYYAVQFQLATPVKGAPHKPAVNGAVDIFVLLNADNGQETKQVKVVSFTADHSFYEFLPANFTVKVHNSGDIYTAPGGNIFITSGKKTVSVLQVNETGGNVIPDSNRLFTSSWSDGFPVYKTEVKNGVPLTNAKGDPKRKLTWDFSKVSKLRFGHYTAHLVLIYNDGTRDIPTEATLSFWVIPWRLLGGLLVLLVFATVGFWSSIRRVGKFFSRNRRKKSGY
jgi:hypothetical protein